MQRTPGHLVTVDGFLKALKKPITFDNAAAVIWAVTKFNERGGCERGWVGDGPQAVSGWKVNPPPE